MSSFNPYLNCSPMESIRPGEFMGYPFEDVRDIIWTNPTTRSIDTYVGTVSLKDANEFNKIILNEKKRIALRPYVLDRFEHWEIQGDYNKSIRLVLMSRCRNEEERKLVKRYIEVTNEL